MSEQQRIARTLLEAAIAKHRAGDLDGAAEDYRQVLVIAPNNADAFHLLGLVLHQRGAHDQAADLIERAMAVNPRQAEYPYNLGKVRAAQDRWVDAAAANRTALALRADYIDARCNLGVALLWQGRPAAAEESLRAALAKDDAHALAWSALGLALHHQNKNAEAATAWERAIALQPDLAEAQFNLGALRLAAGDFARGWEGFAARAAMDPASFNAPVLAAPQWRGESLAGKSILVWGEQGLGEQILFAGLVPGLAARGARVTLACDPRLVTLFARSFADVDVIARDGALPITDVHCPLGALGQYLRPTAESFPTPAAYLRADPARTAALRTAYRAQGGSPVVGISWRSARRRSGAFKSTDLVTDWGPLLRTPGVSFVSVQYGTVDTSLSQAAVHHAVTIQRDPAIDAMKDIDGWASQIAALDLLVSVSNTAVHLAGALGVPAWVIAPAGAGSLWYWPAGQNHTPWYSGVRLYHQPAPGDWAAAIAPAAADLNDWVKTH